MANNRFLMKSCKIRCNPQKFQFCRNSLYFAGFSISNERIEPLSKYLDSIRKFPTPKSATYTRSWYKYRMENIFDSSIWLGITVRNMAKDASSTNNPFVFTDGTLVDDKKMTLKFRKGHPDYDITGKKCASLYNENITTGTCETQSFSV